MQEMSTRKEKLFFLIFGYLFFPFFYLKMLFKKKKNQPKNFLIIDTAKIGDLVCSTPFFRALKKNFPDSYLAVLVISRVKGILENNPNIDDMILVDEFKGIKGGLKLIKLIKSKNFDWSFKLVAGGWEDTIPFWLGISNRVTVVSRHSDNLSNLLSKFSNYRKEYCFDELKSKFNLELLEFLGIKQAEDRREVFYTQRETAKIDKLFKERNIFEKDFLVGISVTAGNKFKEWEPEKFSQLADKMIKELKAKILFLGSREDKEIVDKVIRKMKEKAIDFSGLVDLTTLPALMSRLNLFISVDTGPLYVATALDVPVIDINGPFNVKEQMLPTAKAEIVENKIYCQPCSHLVAGMHFCKERHLKCIKGITVDKVLKAVRKIINKYNLKENKL